MKRAIALVLALLALAPVAQAQGQPATPEIEYPDALVALTGEWVADVERELAPYADRAWFGDADKFLQKAKRESAEGRVRAVMFDLETTVEVLRANALADTLDGLSDAERKSRVIEETQQWKADADQAWADFRARLHGVEGDLESLHALELALYASEVALGGKLNLDTYVSLVPEFRKVNYSRAATIDMARASATPALDIAFAEDILTAALEQEGLPPRMDRERWLRAYAIPETQRPPDESGRLQPWENIANETRPNNETIMSIAIGLAEQRSLRLQQIQLTYGDADSRGIDVLPDAVKFMERRLNRTSYDDVRAYGILGAFTADAIDQARFVLDFHREGKAEMTFVTAAWANLDHQEFAALLLADLSPVRPEHETNLGHQNNLTRFMQAEEKKDERKTPGPGALLVLAGVAVAVVAATRARRGER